LAEGIASSLIVAPTPTKETPMTRKLLLTVATVAGLASFCAGSAFSQALTSPPTSGTPVLTAAMALPPYKPVIDPANFTDNITNPYFPLKPGTTFIYEGKRDDTPRRTEMTVTKETKLIMGVRCVVVRDILTTNTELVEKTTDWYAQDTDGNVWYFGEDTAEYENGKVTSTAGTWMAGVDGALPGIIMKAAPKVGDGYRQEYRPGVAEDYAKVLKLDATAQVPAGNYDGVVVTEDSDLLDTTKLEQKFYARGVGFVASDGMVNGHHEVNKLTKVLKSE
jgi:hypothetical protein